MYRKILVPYDGSQGSQAALDHAAAMAAQNFSMLFIVHAIKEERMVVAHPAYQVPYGGLARVPVGPQINDTTEEMIRVEKEEKGLAILHKAKKGLHIADSLVHTALLHGESSAKEICDFAARKDIDLIVMGNRGLHGVRKLMLGSVSQKVAKNAHCPVMIVKYE